MNEFNQSVVKTRESILETNKVLKNTFMLLSACFVVATMFAMISMAIGLGVVGMWVAFGASIIVLWFVLPRYEESGGIGGLVVTMIFVALTGLWLGPIVSHYLAGPKGAMIVSTALGGTAVIFFALTGYALTTKKDFSFLGGFLFAGFIIAIVASVANIWLKMPALTMAINAAVILIMSGFILFYISRTVNGGETNYISVTVGIFVALVNIFTHLLSLLSSLSGD